MTNITPNIVHSTDAQQLRNIDGYGYFEGVATPRKRHKLEVTFILDMVPGNYHKPEDLMGWICLNPYVDTVTLIKEEPETTT